MDRKKYIRMFRRTAQEPGRFANVAWFELKEVDDALKDAWVIDRNGLYAPTGIYGREQPNINCIN